MYKIIFLDIDGCLNSGRWIKELQGGFDDPKNQMEPAAVQRLNKITDTTGAKIVVSSTWRLFFLHQANALEMLQRCMKCYGITGEVIGMTSDKANAVRNQRGKEIQAWIDDNFSLVEKFIIIDDDSDMGRLKTYLIQTKFEHGLLDEHVEKIIALLGEIPIQ